MEQVLPKLEFPVAVQTHDRAIWSNPVGGVQIADLTMRTFSPGYAVLHIVAPFLFKSGHRVRMEADKEPSEQHC